VKNKQKMSKFDFRETFLKLTEYTTPYTEETHLEDFLIERIPELQRDAIGNYHKIIGESDTLFTCHLDNYCKKLEKVNHVIEGDIVSTDKTTVLGGDNKAGVTILLYMIEQNVPGHYCFFIGEESANGGGCYGSGMFAYNYKDMIKDKKRAVAFDRRATGSIISRQAAQPCCSNEFVDALIAQFAEQKMEMINDPTGFYTDTSSFLEIIPECTNISAGVYNEHSFEEFQDLAYLEQVGLAAAKIDWESLPSVRKAEAWFVEEDDHEKYGENKYDSQLFQVVCYYLGSNNYMQMSRRPFQPGRTMIFNHWFMESKLEVVVDSVANGGACAIINGTRIEIDPKNEKKPIHPKKFKKFLKTLQGNLEEEEETQETQEQTEA
jgi:hypothetical protein